MRIRGMKIAIAALAAGASVPAAAAATKILQPISVTIEAGGTANGQLPQLMINGFGLNRAYVSGLSDFDEFLANNPLHNRGPFTEWLSAEQQSSARITFDFGQFVTIDKLAIWDEDASSVSRFVLSAPGRARFATLANVDTIPGFSTAYGAQVFALAPVTTRFLTFDLEGCNRGGQFNWPGCGIGEVMFRAAPAAAVPEPASWALMIVGLGLAGAAARNRRPGLRFA